MSDRSTRRFGAVLVVIGLVVFGGGMAFGMGRTFNGTMGIDRATGTDFEVELAPGGHAIWVLSDDGALPDIEATVHPSGAPDQVIGLLPGKEGAAAMGSGGLYVVLGRFDVVDQGTYVITTSPPGGVVNVGKSLEQALSANLRFVMISGAGIWAAIAGVIVLIATRDRRPRVITFGPSNLPPQPTGRPIEMAQVAPNHPPVLAPPASPPRQDLPPPTSSQ